MPALSVSNLTMTFIERNLFTDVSFEVESRDKVGFIGANGDVYKRQVSLVTLTRQEKSRLRLFLTVLVRMLLTSFQESTALHM